MSEGNLLKLPKKRLTKVTIGNKIANIMRKIILVSIILILGLASSGFCQELVTNRQILEKLNSIDVRLARVEEGQKSLQKQIDVLREDIKDVRSEIKSVESEMKEFMFWGFGITFAGMFALIGFVLWDRRTALAPAVKKVEALEEREKTIEKIL